MHRKVPLPRGWKRRVRSSVLHILALGLLDSTINVPSSWRPDSLDQFTGRRKVAPNADAKRAWIAKPENGSSRIGGPVVHV